jgi:hypothetical protein
MLVRSAKVLLAVSVVGELATTVMVDINVIPLDSSILR